jgi:WD40 repeat protein/serine/threonine protein kinase
MSSDLDPVDELAEQYLRRRRRGERRTPAEYAERYPERAARILELFPALDLIEGLKPDDVEAISRAREEDAGGGVTAGAGHPGRLGDYQILRELGRGGMGVVYEAEHESLKNRVALKVMHLSFRADRTHLRRFQTEARSAARLHHTNIVPVFDYGEHEGVCYFAMQFISGVGLDRVLADVRRLWAAARGEASIGTGVPGNGAASEAAADPLPVVTRGLLTGRFAAGPTASTVAGSDAPATLAMEVPTSGAPVGALAAADRTGSSPPGGGEDRSGSGLTGAQSEKAYFREVARLGAQVAHALDYAHRQGIVHRDIKPSNILLDAQGNAWVADFGLAKLVEGEDLSRSHDVVGTLRFMAPERFQGVSGPLVDIYSLGATLYELLTLQPAFGEHDQARLIDQITHEPPKPPRQYDRRIPRDLETLVQKALARDPKDRFATAGELAGELRRYLESRPIRSRPIGPAERLWRWCRRNPAVAGLLGVVATALVAVAVIATVYATQQATANREITGLAGKLKTSLPESDRLLASRNFDRGQAAFEKGEIGPGMLWMIESWRSAVAAGDPAWQHAARANLAAWRPHYPRLKAVLSHQSPPNEAAFSPDSRTVISLNLDGTAQLWDAASGKSIGLSLQPGGPWEHFAFSPDGNTVLTVSRGNTAQLWYACTGLAQGPPLHLPPQIRILAIAIQRDGKITLMGTEDKADNIAWLWDAATGKPLIPPLKHRSRVDSVVFRPDSKIIVTRSESRRITLLWDAVTGKPVGSPMRLESQVRAVALSPDGKTILTGNLDGTARLWDAATRQPIGPPMRHGSHVHVVAFSPDSKTILTGSRDKVARLWDAATGQLLGLLEHQGEILPVGISSDGTTLLTGSFDGTVRLWDANPGQPVGQVLEIPSTDVLRLDSGLSPDGKVLTSISQEPHHHRYLQLWDATKRQPIARLPQPGGTEGAGFSLDGKVLLTIAADQTARLWDATTGAPLGAPFPLPCRILPEGYPLGLGPDGKSFWFVGNDQRVWICDGAAGFVRGRTPALGGTPYAVGFSPDGTTFFTGLGNGEVRLWTAATLTPLGAPILQPGGISWGLFSPDGKSLLIASEDGSVRLWDLATRKQLIPPLRHQGPVSKLTFSPNGKTFATGSHSQSIEKTTRLWDVATGQPIGPALKHPSTVVVAFLADGKTLFTQSTVSRLFPVPPDLPDDLERVATWVEVITGLRLEAEQGSIQAIDNAAWLQSRDRLERLGGPPETGPEQRLDAILFGADPTARARAFMERKQWDAAEAAFDEAVRARPFNISIVVQRGDLYGSRGLWSEAAAYYARTVKQYLDVAPLHEQLAITRLLAGDLHGYRAACAGMLAHFKPIDDSTVAIRVAYACSLAPGAVTDLQGLIQVSQRSTRWEASNERVVGAVLFRAGRLEEALSHFGQVHLTS